MTNAMLEEWLCAGPGLVRTAVEECGTVVSQSQLARGTYRLHVECREIAARIVPGQFLMIRPAGSVDPLLGRPLALYDVVRDSSGEVTGLVVVYHVVGKMTSLMSQWQGGERVELWGPLGNGFPPPGGEHLVCVGGGIGYTPFLAVAREAAGVATYGASGERGGSRIPRISFCYGVRTQAERADLTEFSELDSLQIHLSTDDGSEGHHGFVTDLLEGILSEAADRVYCCGPEPMMWAVAKICESRQIDCWLSLETPMACGFGACFSCVTRVRVPEEPGWDYRRTCVEGPVFHSSVLFRPE